MTTAGGANTTGAAGSQTGGAGATTTGGKAGATTMNGGRLITTGGGSGIGKPMPMLTLTPAWEAGIAPRRTAESNSNFFIHYNGRNRRADVSAKDDFLAIFP